MRIWAPDVEMDCAIASRIVSSQFPDFSGETLTFLGRGWDNFCAETLDGTVFRFPTRRAGAEILRHEIAALPIIAQVVRSLPVPAFVHLGQPSADYPYPVVGYRKLSGQTADSLDWPAAARLRAAPVLGQFLSELHSVDANQPELASLPVDDAAKGNPKQILAKLRKRAETVRLAAPELSDLVSHAIQVAERAAQEPLGAYPGCLIHGDFYPRHVLARNGSEGLQVTGIIDWGDVQIGDPAVDLSIVYTFFEPEERPVFWRAYGREESEFNAPVMTARAAMYGVALSSYGLEESDRASLSMGCQILRRLRHS